MGNMGVSGLWFLFPGLFGLVWLVVVVYMVVLATRLVNAVEKIAAQTAPRS